MLESFPFETAKSVIDSIVAETDKSQINCLIFDDSLYKRCRGEGTDLCARVFDHVDHKYRLGFRMMTGGWGNFDTFVPFAQCLLSTRKDSNMVGPDRPTDRRTLCGKRRELAKTKGTDVVLKMVKKAQDAHIPFKYVLFDTWFSNPAQLIDLKNIGADAIAMVKKNSTKYTCVDPKTHKETKLYASEMTRAKNARVQTVGAS